MTSSRSCRQCGTSIDHRAAQARFCSRKCVRARGPILKSCKKCQASFYARTDLARYCGQACKQAAAPRQILDARQKARLAETQVIWARKWKDAALAALGGKCTHCGFDDVRALQFDHVHGDGHNDVRPSDAAGRRQRKHFALGTYYKRIAENAEPGRFQLLCANCNWIKRVENQEHTKRKVV